MFHNYTYACKYSFKNLTNLMYFDNIFTEQEKKTQKGVEGYGTREQI